MRYTYLPIKNESLYSLYSIEKAVVFRAYKASESRRTKPSQIEMYSNSGSCIVGFQTLQM